MVFKKEHTPWNKGTKGIMKAWNKGTAKKVEFTCQQCGKKYEIFPCEIKYRANKYCSKECYFKAGRYPNLDINKIKNLYLNEKLSCKAIAEIIGVGVEVIRTKLKQQGVSLRGPGEYRKGKGSWIKGKKMDKETRKKMGFKDYTEFEPRVVKFWEQDKTDIEISGILEIPRHVVAQIRKKYHLKNKHHLNSLTYKQQENLKRYGVAVNFANANAFKFKTGYLRHELAKFAVCWKLQQLNRMWFTEVKTYGGIIDVYDFTHKVIYEVETTLTPKRKEEKMQLFVNGKMEDIIIFDLRKFSQDTLKMIEEIIKRVV